METTTSVFMLPVYSQTRANKFLEMGWKLEAVNHGDTSGFPEYILGWHHRLPAPCPEGGVFDRQDGDWCFVPEPAAKQFGT